MPRRQTEDITVQMLTKLLNPALSEVQVPSKVLRNWQTVYGVEVGAS